MTIFGKSLVTSPFLKRLDSGHAPAEALKMVAQLVNFEHDLKLYHVVPISRILWICRITYRGAGGSSKLCPSLPMRVASTFTGKVSSNFCLAMKLEWRK